MKKFLSKLSQIIWAIIVTFILIIITYFTLRKSSYFNDYILYIGAILSLILAVLFRKKKVYFHTTIILILIVSSFNTFKIYNNNLYKEHSINWDNDNHFTTIPFYGSETGQIFIKTKINEETKYLGFDTGADISALNEKYNNSASDDTISIKNSQDEKHYFGIQELNKLVLGNVYFKKLSYIPLEIEEWENSKGFFNSYENKDSIAGILGNNIINSFVWDFNMDTKSIKITDKKFSENKSDVTIIPLIKSGNSWNIEIDLNGRNKNVKLDTGSNSILSLKDSLVVSDKDIKISSSSTGINSFKNNSENRDRKDFADIKIGNILFEKTLVSFQKKSNLLGIPLFWEYERIVLDFIDHKMYIYEKTKNKNTYSITNINKSIKEFIEKVNEQKPVPNNGYK